MRSRQVSAELRRLRKGSGLTAGEVGARLGISQSKISRIENGQMGLHPEEVAAMLGLFHVTAERRERLLDLVREAEKPGLVQIHGGELPEQWDVLIDWERKANALRNYEPTMIPGLLQTADYARAIIHGTAAHSRTESQVDTKVSARLARHAILSRPLPPQLHALVAEPALRIPLGGPGVLAAQLRHLGELVRRPHVRIQVVPLAAGPHPGLEGPFVIMDFPDDPTLVHLENRVMSIFLEEEPHIASYRLAWQRIHERALTPKRSAELIAKLAVERARDEQEPT